MTRALLVICVLASPAAADTVREKAENAAIAAVDSWMGELIARRHAQALARLAPTVGLANIELKGACKKSFGKPVQPRSSGLVKCLASDVKWPVHRIAGTSTTTKSGWIVVIDDIVVMVRARSGGELEIASIAKRADLSR